MVSVEIAFKIAWIIRDRQLPIIGTAKYFEEFDIPKIAYKLIIYFYISIAVTYKIIN